MTSSPALCRITLTTALDHDWETRQVVLDHGEIEETQECRHCGLRRVVTRRDEEFAAFTDMGRAAA